jgi:hypothetical protein
LDVELVVANPKKRQGVELSGKMTGFMELAQTISPLSIKQPPVFSIISVIRLPLGCDFHFS